MSEALVPWPVTFASSAAPIMAACARLRQGKDKDCPGRH